MIDWIEFFARQPGFSRREVGNIEAVEVPIYEAILASQLLTSNRNNQVYIETEDEAVLNFPKPVPTVLIDDIRADFTQGRIRGASKQLNPLLSPSLKLMAIEYPSFFKNSRKYLTRKRFDSDDMGGEPIEDRVCISFPNAPNQIGESLTEYLASMYLRREGYIVDRFSGGLPGRGGPDLFAIKIPDLQRQLRDAGITADGFYMNELELPSIEKFNSTLPREKRTAVLEIESAYDKNRFYDAKDEAKEYAEGGWFDDAIGVLGFAHDKLEDWEDKLEVGFITFDESGNFHRFPSPVDYGTEKTQEVEEIVRRVVKLALLKNKPLDETMEYLQANSFFDAAKNVDQKTTTDVLDFIGYPA